SFWNISKVNFAKKRSAIAVNYTPWLKDLGLTDVYLASAGFYKKIDDNSSINSSLRFFSLGNIQFSDVNGTPTTEQRPNEFSYDFG
ncbi:MAG: hypothetical protein ACK42B_09320, partial [Chitinophagaceae bacterium]